MTEHLISKGAKIVLEYKGSCTLMHDAASSGNIRIAQLLLSKGLKVDVRSCQEDTPLFYAIRSGDFDMVKFLIRSGAKVNTCDRWKSTPLHEAVSLYYIKTCRSEFIRENEKEFERYVIIRKKTT